MLVKCIYEFETIDYTVGEVETGTLWNTLDNPFAIIIGSVGLESYDNLSWHNYINIPAKTFLNCFERSELD